MKREIQAGKIHNLPHYRCEGKKVLERRRPCSRVEFAEELASQSRFRRIAKLAHFLVLRSWKEFSHDSLSLLFSSIRRIG